MIWLIVLLVIGYLLLAFWMDRHIVEMARLKRRMSYVEALFGIVAMKTIPSAYDEEMLTYLLDLVQKELDKELDVHGVGREG